MMSCCQISSLNWLGAKASRKQTIHTHRPRLRKGREGGRLRERDSVKWERRKKSEGRAAEEGRQRQHAARTHAPSLPPFSRQSNPAARGQKEEREERSCCTATVGRPFLLLSFLPSLPAEIEPDVVGRSVCGGEEKEGRVEREGRRLQRM